MFAFLSWLDGENYDLNTEVSEATLAAITAEEVVQWMKYRAYGTSTPSENDRPIHARSSSLLYWKKALSSFMPNRNMVWDDTVGRGNPTRSAALNELVRNVRRYEVRGQGTSSSARRPLRESEFRSVVAEFRKTTDIYTLYGMPAFLAFQFHLIGRVDDVCKFKCENLRPHDVHSTKCAQTRLAWSKNVNEERDAPWQFLLGAMDSLFCCILNLGLWLEIFHGTLADAGERPFVFGFSQILDNDEKAAENAKDKIYRWLRRIFGGLGFTGVGSHSIRKFASTYTRNNGVSKDDKDYRGRWKKTGRVSDQYDDIQLDYVDARVASVLCPGGPCYYVVEDAAISDEWIAEHVSPNINRVFGMQLAVLFGKALLWLAFMPADYEMTMPHDMRLRIHTAYAAIQTTEDGLNPVKRRLIVITGESATVYMNDVAVDNDDNNGNGIGGGTNIVGDIGTHSTHTEQLILSLQGQTNALRQTIAAQSHSIEMLRGALVDQRKSLRKVLMKIESQPIHMLQRAARNGTGYGPTPHNNARPNTTIPTRRVTDDFIDARAVLSPHPKTLHQLWDEYIRGNGHNKPAKFFTRAERGRAKSKYSRRLVFWKTVERLTNRNIPADEAIDRIRVHYGINKSVTAIINALRTDRNGNGLPLTLR